MEGRVGSKKKGLRGKFEKIKKTTIQTNAEIIYTLKLQQWRSTSVEKKRCLVCKMNAC